MQDIIEPEINQGEQRHVEEKVNEETRSQYKETETTRDQGDDVEHTMEKEEDGDGLKQIRENFIKSRKILTPTPHERIEERERLVKPKTKIRKKDIEVLEE